MGMDAKSTFSTLETRALQYLARREYARQELAQKLAADGKTATHVIADLLDQLEAQGFLSDERFVAQTIRTRRPKFGKQRIMHELKQKGIDAQLIEQTLSELTETELDTAYMVWKKKFGVAPENAKEHGKQMRFMMSRGYTTDTIRQVFAQAKTAAEQEYT